MAEIDDASKIAPKALPFPSHLTIAKPRYRPAVKRVPVDRFFKQEFHDREVERIWKKAWQWACREEDIAEIGDFHIYEVADLSFIVIRTGEQEFKAYWNSCPHRARRIRDRDGKRADELRCMFHGWAWNIDGRIKEMNCGYDFPGTGKEVQRLRECQTGVWAGFVFINPDLDAEPLEDFLGEMPEHFAALHCDFGTRWKQVHVVAELACNWKVAQEAFLEPWHVMATHPQLVAPPRQDAAPGERWDDFGNWMRNAPAQPSDVPAPPPGWGQPAETEEQYLNGHFDYHLNEDNPFKPQAGKSVREIVMENAREKSRRVIGDEIDEIHDFHIAGYEMVSLFPNLHPWGGYSRLVYRFRPYKSDPERCLMDVLFMSPWPKDKPKPPPAHPQRLGPDEPITNAPQLGYLSRIFLQDLGNLAGIQAGLKTSPLGYVLQGVHHDTPVRHFHDLYEAWMGIEESGYSDEENDQ